VLVSADELITEEHIRALKKSEKANGPLPQAHVRSVMTCRIRRGVCQKCYGYDLAYNKLAKLGAAVGIMAAQSIGEPGTQLTMRTFHTGGVAGKDITQGLPRVEELFEARTPKRKAIMSEVSGKVEIEKTERSLSQAGTGKQMLDATPGQRIVRVRFGAVDEKVYSLGRGAKLAVEDGAKVHEGDTLATKASGEVVKADVAGTAKVTKTAVTIVHDAEKSREYIIPQGYTLFVKDGDEVSAGDVLTDGHLDLQALYKFQGKDAVQKYLSKEIQFIYSSQGQKLNNKHIEIIIKQMFSRVRVLNPGDTDLLPGEIVEKATLLDEQEKAGEKGGNLAEFEELFLGITKVSLSTESWLSSASFQETARVLISAAVTGKVDTLAGLKENVIIGRLIPAGTGFGDNAVEFVEETRRMNHADDVLAETPVEAPAAVPTEPLAAEIASEGPQLGTTAEEAPAADKAE
ncbi:DNA-directed RNA polymerase subunit beta', partial [Candidatus Uhrbacteria bacterium]|nr:DNA-directed RNA polymerase subunit beta' [Candidatus Uhrbacteria bacterium]